MIFRLCSSAMNKEVSAIASSARPRRAITAGARRQSYLEAALPDLWPNRGLRASPRLSRGMPPTKRSAAVLEEAPTGRPACRSRSRGLSPPPRPGAGHRSRCCVGLALESLPRSDRSSSATRAHARSHEGLSYPATRRAVARACRVAVPSKTLNGRVTCSLVTIVISTPLIDDVSTLAAGSSSTSV